MSMEFRKNIDKEELLIDCMKLRGFILENNLKNKINKIRDKFIERESKKKEDWDWSIEAIIYRFAEAIKKEI